MQSKVWDLMIFEKPFIIVPCDRLFSFSVKDDGVLDLDIHQFDSHCIVILRYVDSEDKLELQTLFALQAICHKLQHPPSE